MIGEGATRNAGARLDIDVERALDPVEAEGVFRDTRECAGPALLSAAPGSALSASGSRPGKNG